jgi:4-hydroxy-tetrahydrodipicolinate synthase
MPNYPAFHGTYTALVTPFRNGEFDEASFARLIENQIAGGVDGILPMGTTGESPTVTEEEHLLVVRKAVEIADKRVKVIGGAGLNSTAKTLKLVKEVSKLGVDGLLLVAPYYNKPTQPGLVAHFTEVAKATNLPIILYSIPGRCGIEIGADTVATLAQNCPNIVALKESGGTVDRVSALRQILPESFTLLSGDDYLTLPFMSVGAKGVISVASNVVPKEVSMLVNHALKGNYAEAEKIHRKYYPLFRDLFIEANPGPTKYVLSRKGWMTEEVRLPLVPPQPHNRALLDKLIKNLGINS